MAPITHDLDLGRLGLSAGEGRRMQLDVAIEPFELAGQRYEVQPARVPVTVDVARTVGGGHALRLRLWAQLAGPCMRCLEPAAPPVQVDAREVDQPGAGEELDSPYVSGDVLDLTAWARDALALALPAQLLCREDCAGLCPICAENLNDAGPEHHHERAPDPRWAKLSELTLPGRESQ